MKKIKLFSLATFLFGAILGLTSLSGCGRQKDTFIDYASTSDVVRLKYDYKDENGKNRVFEEDGIALVDLVLSIDGDTAHFKPTGVEDYVILKARFYGIDTPESTAQFEPYGLAASRFTEQTLKNSKTIVMTGETLELVPPSFDSTGGRYVSNIWVSEKENCPFEELKCLNLMLVQEGLSGVKNANKIPEYEDVFYQAEQQAKDRKMNIWSGQPDPEYVPLDDTIDTDIFTIMDDQKSVMKGESEQSKFHMKRVRVRGTVAGYANNTLYVQASHINDDGTTEYASLNIYCGPKGISARYTIPNTYIRITGLIKNDEKFGFQMTDPGEFPRVPIKENSEKDDGNKTVVIKKADEVIGSPLEAKEWTADLNGAKQLQYEALNSVLHLSGEYEVIGGYNSRNANPTPTLFLKDATTGQLAKGILAVHLPWSYSPYPTSSSPELSSISWTHFEDFVGHVFEINGIYGARKRTSDDEEGTTYYTYNIIPRNNDDIVTIR